MQFNAQIGFAAFCGIVRLIAGVLEIFFLDHPQIDRVSTRLGSKRIQWTGWTNMDGCGLAQLRFGFVRLFECGVWNTDCGVAEKFGRVTSVRNAL
jgi:hypothetical protein